jgi:hypothetical protein
MEFTGRERLAWLEKRREEIVGALSLSGEFTPGSVGPTFRKCGKPTCHCAVAGDVGHGPRWLWNWPRAGRTMTTQVPAARVDEFGEGVAGWRRFQGLVDDLVDVNAEIARRGLVVPGLARSPRPGSSGEKGGS